MSLIELATICFGLGVGIYLLVADPTINQIAKVVGAVGGIVLGVALIFNL